jgi:hypothetical protein
VPGPRAARHRGRVGAQALRQAPLAVQHIKPVSARATSTRASRPRRTRSARSSRPRTPRRASRPSSGSARPNWQGR